MRRSIVVCFCFLFLTAALSLHAQVVPAASSSSFAVDAGGFGSGFQPDYAGEGTAQTGPERLYGVGAYTNVRFSRWVQLEGEARWLQLNQYHPCPNCPGISENNYLIGPSIPIGTFKKFSPYGKVLVGMGGGSFLNGHSFVLAYGGGLEYHWGRRLTPRVDFEYQQWRITPTLWPYGVSVGMTYRVFGPH